MVKFDKPFVPPSVEYRQAVGDLVIRWAELELSIQGRLYRMMGISREAAAPFAKRISDAVDCAAVVQEIAESLDFDVATLHEIDDFIAKLKAADLVRRQLIRREYDYSGANPSHDEIGAASEVVSDLSDKLGELIETISAEYIRRKARAVDR